MKARPSGERAGLEDVLGTVLISVAIGVGLAALFVGGGFWLQVLVGKASSAFAPALMIASLMVRLVVLAAVVIPLAVYTDLNLIALLAAFAVVFTALQTWMIAVQVKKSNAPGQGSKES
jgi:hypothetical protein